MELNKRNRIFLLTAVFLFFASALCAQEPGFYIDSSSSRLRIYQRFVWEAEEFAINYEVVIQVYNDGYREHSRITTEENYVDFYLPPGQYRYSVTPRDLLNRRGDTSGWKEFEVMPAYPPKIEKFVPDVFFLDQRLERVLDITGVNLLEESQIFLHGPDGPLYPDKVNILSDGKARLVFNDEKLVEGEYDIYVVNPGGFETNAGGFSVSYRKSLYLYMKFSYAPVVPISGELYDVFGSNLFLPGFSFSLETISTKRSTFNGGIELAASYYLIDPAMSLVPDVSDIDASTSAIGVDINIALQKQFLHGRMAVTFRFGVGFSFMSSSGDYTTDESVIHLNLGLSSLFWISKIVYFETGADFNHNQTTNPSDIIKPRIGLVLRF